MSRALSILTALLALLWRDHAPSCRDPVADLGLLRCAIITLGVRARAPSLRMPTCTQVITVDLRYDERHITQRGSWTSRSPRHWRTTLPLAASPRRNLPARPVHAVLAERGALWWSGMHLSNVLDIPLHSSYMWRYSLVWAKEPVMFHSRTSGRIYAGPAWRTRGDDVGARQAVGVGAKVAAAVQPPVRPVVALPATGLAQIAENILGSPGKPIKMWGTNGGVLERAKTGNSGKCLESIRPHNVLRVNPLSTARRFARTGGNSISGGSTSAETQTTQITPSETPETPETLRPLSLVSFAPLLVLHSKGPFTSTSPAEMAGIRKSKKTRQNGHRIGVVPSAANRRKPPSNALAGALSVCGRMHVRAERTEIHRGEKKTLTRAMHYPPNSCGAICWLEHEGGGEDVPGDGQGNGAGSGSAQRIWNCEIAGSQIKSKIVLVERKRPNQLQRRKDRSIRRLVRLARTASDVERNPRPVRFNAPSARPSEQRRRPVSRFAGTAINIWKAAGKRPVGAGQTAINIARCRVT